VEYRRNFIRCLRHVGGVLIVLFGVIVLGAIVIARSEGIEIGPALYFALITGLTVGYGDIAPVTPVGQIVSILIGIVGVLVSGLVIGVSTRAFMLTMPPEDE
jgi:voltage-gated potassium channel